MSYLKITLQLHRKLHMVQLLYYYATQVTKSVQMFWRILLPPSSGLLNYISDSNFTYTSQWQTCEQTIFWHHTKNLLLTASGAKFITPRSVLQTKDHLLTNQSGNPKFTLLYPLVFSPQWPPVVYTLSDHRTHFSTHACTSSVCNQHKHWRLSSLGCNAIQLSKQFPNF
jgi:hypothetical protein